MSEDSRGRSAAADRRLLEELRQENINLRRALKGYEAEVQAARAARAVMEQLQRKVDAADVPKWLVSTEAPRQGPGVPTLFLSDWHTGETVKPQQIYGLNAFNREVQERRVRQTVNGAVDLLQNHMVKPSYPGIVLALGGDMVTGDIHEELTATNWCDIREAVRVTTGQLVWTIETLADRFGKVFVPAVTGNHGRFTKRMQFKRRTGTSADAIIYDNLQSYFAKDRNVTFAITEGTAVFYRVFGHRYFLAHGDPGSIGSKGGDGIIGAIGPIIRGQKKLMARNSQIGMDFDTLLLAHWHQYMPLPSVIVNGSVKGYDEFAWGLGFEYQPPQQALWLTHPERGITCSWPVFADAKGKAREGRWVSLYREAV